jgi:hypothetical protein
MDDLLVALADYADKVKILKARLRHLGEVVSDDEDDNVDDGA